MDEVAAAYTATRRIELPGIVALFALGLLVFTQGRSWIERTTAGLAVRGTHTGNALVSFALSLGQVAIPLLTLILLVEAIENHGALRHSRRGDTGRPALGRFRVSGL